MSGTPLSDNSDPVSLGRTSEETTGSAVERSPRRNSASAAVPASAAPSRPAMIQAGGRGLLRASPSSTVTRGEEPGVVAATSSAKSASRPEPNLSSGALARHRPSTRTTAGDTSGRSSASGVGSSRRIAVIVSAAVSRAKARRPASIS